jgi:hypothetical protein
MEQSAQGRPGLLGLKIIIGVFILSSVSAVFALVTFHRFQYIAEVIINIVVIVGLVRRSNPIRIFSVVLGVILGIVIGVILAFVVFFSSTIRESHWLIPFLCVLWLFEIWTVVYLRSPKVRAAFRNVV